MSKLYKKYMSLKINDSSKVYLFKSGIFYIFLDDDARTMSPILNLKLSNLNSVIVKCGFPINSCTKYFNILKKLDYDICVIENNYSTSNISIYQNYCNLKNIIDNFLSVNIDNLSISESFDLLTNLQKDFNFVFQDTSEKWKEKETYTKKYINLKI